MRENFWKNKRVLITGHTGFKGGWLSLWLMHLGAEVTGYALAPAGKSLYNQAGVGSGMNSVFGDIRNLEHLKKVFRQTRPEIVFHLAAQPLVLESYKNPVETYQTNVMGTVNVLEAVRLSGDVRVLVCVTSDKCYENKEWVWGYREEDTLGGQDPYSSSKGCDELVIAAYRKSFFNTKEFRRHGVTVASTRAGNVIGGGDWASDRLIPDIISAFIQNRPVYIRNPGAIRPWQHVLDPLSGYMLLAAKMWGGGPGYSQAWNFGPPHQEARSVSEVVGMMAGLWDEGVRWEQDPGDYPHEAGYLKLDCSKAHSLLNWAPRLNLTEALEWLVDWYTTSLNSDSMHDFTMKQICNYEKLEVTSAYQQIAGAETELPHTKDDRQRRSPEIESNSTTRIQSRRQNEDYPDKMERKAGDGQMEHHAGDKRRKQSAGKL